MGHWYRQWQTWRHTGWRRGFDCGPYVFLGRYDLGFTAASFDDYGRSAYGNQPAICRWNLQQLQAPLSAVIPLEAMKRHCTPLAIAAIPPPTARGCSIV